MGLFAWDEEKNEWLKRERGISFEEIEAAIGEGRVLADIDNPSKKHLRQKILIVRIGSYAFSVPYVRRGKTCFLKTVYPSRKFTKQFIKGK